MGVQGFLPQEMSSMYPFSSQTHDLRSDLDAVTVVDIGGGAGDAIHQFRQNFPHLPDRFVLQDLPKSIRNLDMAGMKDIGIELMEYDFFQPQPIKGAKYYHFRHILHNWPDELGLKILRATRVAMEESTDYSRLLIRELVLPDTNYSVVEAFLDITMWCLFNGQERTELEWVKLLRRARFEIVEFWRPQIGTDDCVIKARVAAQIFGKSVLWMCR